MAKVARGDVVAGALGHRKALFGYSGHLPTKLAAGDVIQMLNIGGVLGICDSANPDKGRPFDCRVLGTVLHFPYLGERIGVPARVGLRTLDYGAALDTGGVPVVALAGTCMEAGKTAAACAMISRMRHRGLVVDAFKATGVSLRRDILAIEDSGARRTAIFTDFGIVTTTPKTGPALTRTMLTEMAAGKPDVIVFELGDGILGAYGVEAILDAPDIRESLTAVVLSANDPVAAWGGVKLLRERFGIEPAAVTGPSTDNSVGVDIIREQLKVPGVQRDDERRRARRLRDHGGRASRRSRTPARSRERPGMSARVPAIILGGTGYVAGELLRLTLAHPRLELAAIASDSQPGEPVAKAFPHLAAACGDLRYVSIADATALAARQPRSAVLAAAPHGVSHALIDGLLTRRRGDRREALGRRHLRGLPLRRPRRVRTRLQARRTARPRARRTSPARCRSTSTARRRRTSRIRAASSTASLLAAVPLLSLGLVEGPVFVSAVTGSTGAGRSPIAGTHHPLRHSDLYAYNALDPPPRRRDRRARARGHGARRAHRLRAALRAVRARHPRDGAGDAARSRSTRPPRSRRFAAFYAGRPFVRVLDEPPRVKDVVASNYAHLSAAADGRTIVVMSVVDNLVKGAAGGAMQWMNRLLGFDETDGLTAPAPGWT